MSEKARRGSPSSGGSASGRGAGGAVPPSLNGGAPARERELRAQGRRTMQRLLDAGRATFDRRGFHAARVDDVVRAAKTSHGTFYLYFSNKEDLFKALAHDALLDMGRLAEDFPSITPDAAGRAALRAWVKRFCDTYRTHSTVIRILSDAEVVGRDLWGDGLQRLFHLSEALSQGMATAGVSAKNAELTALACLMMAERVNYLLAVGVRLPREDMIERLTDITFSAFFPGRSVPEADPC